MRFVLTMTALAMMLCGGAWLGLDALYHFVETPELTEAAVFWSHPTKTTAAMASTLAGVLLSFWLDPDPRIMP